MDKSLYLSMTAATNTMLSESTVASNLANANMPGFRADLEQFRSMPVFGDGHPSRVYAMSERPGIDYSHGTIYNTGNELDFAINGEGFIAVQAPDGTEAYTRRGDMRLNNAGLLENGNGLLVLGNGGPIALPPAEEVVIGTDGTISIRPAGQDEKTLATLDRIRLVNPPVEELYKAGDGLFRLKTNLPAPVDASVQVAPESLETSNVSMVGAMARMIEHARNFELNIKAMTAAKENDEVGTRILSLN
jgi:flagellar basal-body rod protein FlgF